MAQTAITPTRSEDYPEWYQQVVQAADLAEHSPVRGCMVIKPWGYRLWENMQKILDGMFKETGHENAYFPLFIPLSFLQKEAQHIEGFAKECAVVTHHRLEKNQKGELVPAGELDEPLIVRPTSETMIGEMFSRWVHSYRDLPLLINQWANVVRWEMRTRLFLRTTEFLWQEGHTAHAKETEAREETMRMLGIYETFVRDFLAIPAIIGEKTASERFPGAVSTYTLEAMMQDGKALQCGTSHFLGQNFAKASQIKFRDEEGGEQFAWTTSWGMTTRLIGAMIMVHSDDDGLVLPPRIASAQIVIIPVIHKEEVRAEVLAYCKSLAEELRGIEYAQQPLKVIIDERDLRGGEKTWSWIKKGVPIRLEIGPRDMAADMLTVAYRTRPPKSLPPQKRAEFVKTVGTQLDEIQKELYDKAVAFRDAHLYRIDSKEEFIQFFNSDQPKGFALSHWSGDAEVEEFVQKEFAVTIRCIPLDEKPEEGRCVITGKKSSKRVIYAKAY